ncbi:6-phosphogluconolactonase [Glaciecola petra]|uniref:6-phosphogluconolactonase n=1 Tax=Glaciecola petra TaxID=3075602 RepID=A0ABU2ZN31_9ALTE|nr:6-phosphogluconolactonase [Aestuariibacter sp. P117]MDT0594029.1 6-phosphogluconolactonase [Aestuariibacter sp. P117]
MSVMFNKYTNADNLNTSFANKILAKLRRGIEDNGVATMAVSGGSTPKPLFDLLANKSFDWTNVIVTLVDERWVDSQHADSNEKLVKENLLVEQAAAAKFVSLTADYDSPYDAENEISQRIDDIADEFDVLVLGMGEDGHTASLFPCSEQIDAGLDLERELSAIATQPTTASHLRMSMSLAKIIKAKNIYLHLVGDKKLAVLEDALANYDAKQKPIKAVCDEAQVSLMWAP